MAESASTIAGYVILCVGAVLLIVAIILIIYVLMKRSERKSRMIRTQSPDAFKVVYKVPTANGVTTTDKYFVNGDFHDGKSVHTLARSETGYNYVPPMQTMAPSLSPTVLTAPPMVLSAPPVGHQMSRQSAFDYVTLPRATRSVISQPRPQVPGQRVLLPIGKRYKGKNKNLRGRQLYVPAYTSGSRSMYSTSPRSPVSLISAPAYATSARSTASARAPPKYFLYGSTPNLAQANFTQPVLMYDRHKKHYLADEIPAGSSHVHNWLQQDVGLNVGDTAEYVRPRSRASSAPEDVVDSPRADSSGLHMQWSPSMKRRMEENDRARREAGIQANGVEVLLGPDDRRYMPLHHTEEATMSF